MSIEKKLRSELKKIGFSNTSIEENYLKLLLDIESVSQGNEYLMHHLSSFLVRIILGYPLTPITENDLLDEGNGYKRSKQYKFLYQAPDGKFYDDRYFVFVNFKNYSDRRYIYNKNQNSKQEVQLPYYPEERPIYTVF